MALTVLIRSGEVEAPPSVTFDEPRVVLGRGESCDIRLPDPTVSHRHASFRQRGADYIVMDEGSTNGTFVGPVRLPPQTPRVVRSGDLIRVGRIWIEVRLEQTAPARDPQAATREIALELVARALEAEGTDATLRVRVRSGPDGGKTLELADFERSYIVGRGGGAALSLEDPDVSRRHVELLRRGAKVFVRELGSKNGAQLAQEPLAPNALVVWKRSTELQVGQNVLEYEDPAAEALAEIERAVDERMREDESIEPPVGLEATAPRGEPLRTPAPAAVAPRLARAARHPRPARGWSGTDYLVALLSVVVLLMSIVGFWWLFGTD